MSKTIVITGATSGIGKELVKLFAQDDWTVFAGYRNENLCFDAGKNVVWFNIDLTNSNSIRNASDIIYLKTDKIDVLINCAGTVAAGPVEKLDTNRLIEQFRVNVFGHIEFVQNLCEILSGGRIVNISSMASFGNFPFISPYCASKRSLDIFFNAFEIENHKNIKVISIKPGVVATEIWEKSVKNNEKILENCKDYEKEMIFMKTNALSNSRKGLSPVKIAEDIKKIVLLKNPKPSYTIGLDAKFARILSFLPQGVINFLVSKVLKLRVKKVFVQ